MRMLRVAVDKYNSSKRAGTSGDSLSISAFRPMVVFHCLPAFAICLSCASPSSGLGVAFIIVGESVVVAAVVI
jgi:hypothetical protein